MMVDADRPRVSRRSVLASGLGVALVSGRPPGSALDPEPVSESGDPVNGRVPTVGSSAIDGLSIENLRVVQTVENTRLISGGDRTVADDAIDSHPAAPDPTLVSGRNAAAVFDLSFHGERTLPDDACPLRVRVGVAHTGSGGTEDATLGEFVLPADSVTAALERDAVLLDQFVGLHPLPIRDDERYVQGQVLARSTGVPAGTRVVLRRADGQTLSEDLPAVHLVPPDDTGRVYVPPGAVRANRPPSALVADVGLGLAGPAATDRTDPRPGEAFPLSPGEYLLERTGGEQIVGFEIQEYPVFPVDEHLQTVTVRIGPSDPSRVDSAKDTNSDPDSEPDSGLRARGRVDPGPIRQTRPVGVGFIAVENRDEADLGYGRLGDGYGELTAASDPDDRRRRIWQIYVGRAAEYLQRTLPTPELRCYRHGIAHSLPATVTSENWDDLYRARDRVEAAVGAATERPAPRGEFFAVRNGRTDPDNPVDPSAFVPDVIVAVVPRGYPVGSKNPVYWGWEDEHPIRQPATATVVRLPGPTEAGGPRRGLAHEVAHHFLGAPYEGDLAQDRGPTSGPSHASGRLRSTAYDLERGSFRVRANQASLLSNRAGVASWPDAIAYARAADDGFAPTPAEGDRLAATIDLLGSTLHNAINDGLDWLGI